MHGRTHVWLACGLAVAVIWATCGVVNGQDFSPVAPADAGYTLAADSTYATPAMGAQNDYTASPAALSGTDADLVSRVAALEAALAEAKQNAEGAQGEPVSQKLSVKAGGRFYVDDVFFGQSAGSMAALGDAQDTLFVRTARLHLAGKGFGVISYKIEVDLAGVKNYTAAAGAAPADHTHAVAGVGVTTFRDVYLAVHDLPWLGTVYVGHFKEPFSLEELTSTRFITFMERSLINVFAPDRNIGIMATQVTASENATFSIGVFRTIDDRPPYIADDDHGDAVTMRATWLPWYDAATEGRGLLHLGFGFGYRNVDDPVQRLRQHEEIYAGPYVVDTGNFGNVTDIILFNPEIAFVYGPFSVQTEYIGASYIRDAGVGDAYFDGIYVQASYFLTGENRVYDRHKGAFTRIRPYENFFRVRDENGYVFTGKGAWEVAYRYSYLDLNHASAQVWGGWDSSHTIGVNWYLNPYTRLMFNYIHSDVGLLDAASTFLDVFAVRAQIDF